MIASIRKSLKSNTYRIFLWISLLFIILGGLAKLEFGDTGEKKWLAKVGHSTLTIDTYNTALMGARKNIEYRKQNGETQLPKNVEKLVLEQNIADLLVDGALDDLRVTVSDAIIEQEVLQQLQNLPAAFFNERGELNQELFLQAFAPYTLQDIEKDIARQIRMGALQGMVESLAYVPHFEAMLYYDNVGLHKEFSMLEFSLGKSREAVQKPSDQDLQNLLASSNVEIRKLEIPEKRSGIVWKFSPEDYGIKVSDEQVKEFYNVHKAEKYMLTHRQVQVRRILLKITDENKKQDVKTRAGQLHQELIAHPDKFETYAKEYSQDEKTAGKGGLTEFFEEGNKNLDSVFAETVFKEISAQNPIAPLIKTAHGFEILQFIAEKQPTYKSLSAVEDKVKKDVLTKKFAERFAKDAQRVLNTQETNPAKIQEFIDKRKATKETLHFQAKQTDSLFNTQLFKLTKNEYAAFIDKDTGFIILCEDVDKAKMPAVQEVRAKLEDEYYKEQAIKNLEKTLREAYAYAKTHTLEETAIQFGTRIENATEKDHTLQHPHVASKVRILQHPGMLTFAIGYDRGILVRLDSVSENKEEKSVNSQEALIAKLVTQGRVHQAQGQFIASLYRHDKLNNNIQLNDQLIPQILKEA